MSCDCNLRRRRRDAPAAADGRPAAPVARAVGTSNPAASECGEAAFARGGSAVDAAIAANLCQSALEPGACGMGGDLFAQVWHNGRLMGYNGAGRSPAVARFWHESYCLRVAAR